MDDLREELSIQNMGTLVKSRIAYGYEEGMDEDCLPSMAYSDIPTRKTEG